MIRNIFDNNLLANNSINSDQTLAYWGQEVTVDATSGNRLITLPYTRDTAPTGAYSSQTEGRILIRKKDNTANTVTIEPFFPCLFNGISTNIVLKSQNDYVTFSNNNGSVINIHDTNLPDLVKIIPIGTIIQTISQNVSGYLLCNGTSYNRSDYTSLFNLLNTNQGTVTLTIANPCVVTKANHGLTTGQKVYFTTTGALPTGLSANTTYWINVTGVNTFNLATSYANLITATYITTTGTQSGVHTMFLTIGTVSSATTFNVPDYQSKVLAGVSTAHGVGKFTGAETHTLTIAQMPSHSHYVQGYVYNDYDADNIFSNRQGLDTGANQYNTNSVGGGQAHNNMQPTEFVYFHIKF